MAEVETGRSGSGGVEAVAVADAKASRAAALRTRAEANLWWAGPAAVLLLVAAAHLPTLNDYFFGDDFPELAPVAHASGFRYLQDVLTLQGETRFWRLLTRLAVLAEHRAFGLSAGPYHAVNLAVHLGNVLLAYLVARSFTRRTGVALVAALAFGLTPAHAVSVAWITALNRLLHTFFFLLTLLLLRRALVGSRVHHGWLAAAVAVFLVDVLTDEVVVAFVPVLLAWAWLVRFRTDRDVRRLAAATAPFIVVGLAVAAAAVAPQLGTQEVSRSEYGLGLHMVRNLWIYLGRLALPVGTPTPDAFGLLHRVAGLAVAALGLLYLRRGPDAARFLVVWCLLALLPFTLWVNLTAPRYTYLASVPFSIGLAWLGGEALRRADRRLGPLTAPAAAGALAVLVLFFAWRTGQENGGQAFAADRYRVLVTELQQALPEPEAGSTIYITDGIWTDRWDNVVWLRDVAATLYGNGSTISNVEGPCVPDLRRDGPVYTFRYRDRRLVPLEPAAARCR